MAWARSGSPTTSSSLARWPSRNARPPPGLSEADRELAACGRCGSTSAARINHPNAVTLYDSATAADDAVYLIMELIDGPTLGQLIQANGPPPEATAAAWGLQLLDVLEAAHDLGIAHRDIKPANIMITSAGQAKLTDSASRTSPATPGSPTAASWAPRPTWHPNC